IDGGVTWLLAAVIVWAFIGLAVTLAYPFAKRFVSIPQAVLGIAFSIGIPMAFCAAGGAGVPASEAFARVPLAGWLLLLGNLGWVLAYDTEYAMVDRDDDLKIGMKTSAITFGRFDVVVVMACYAIYLVCWGVAGVGRSLGPGFHVGLALAAVQVLWHWRLIASRSRDGCFKAFRLNHWVGAAVFAGIVAGHLWR
ncbi:MAG: 4-hydroxybenzoate octaprenyltransferase, partial [Comamonadaceae bacterium]